MNKPTIPSRSQRFVISENGPCLVYGDIPLSIQEIVPNEEGQSCGQSANMPFCNGSHASIKFNDGLMI